MSAFSNQSVVVVKKSTHARHAHHGGAWKVAYADFVTAMMAFFLVMWIVGQSKQTKEAIAGYFRDPVAFENKTGAGSGVLPGADSGLQGGGRPVPAPPTDIKSATATLERAAEHLREALSKTPEFAALKDRIEIQVTDEGLRIELLEAPNDGFFASGSAELKRDMIVILTIIAQELKKMENKVAVEGHTDRRPYSPGQQYTNWELSSDRANAARRALQEAGVREEQLDAVRGFASTRLRLPDNPLASENRRISIVVRRLGT
ncbi:MAG TPA: flagellar motor protein MotB [Vicinamibacterales bacterium]|nr:flagellar motor protein MotB [Vicinamibacterales bacterium]